jgi:ABC-type sulfate transport system permease component
VIGRRLFAVALVLATALALGFLLLPLIAIFLRVPPGDLVSQLGSDVALDAIVVTLKTTLVAQALTPSTGPRRRTSSPPARSAGGRS